MKITIKQLKQLIKEQVEEESGMEEASPLPPAPGLAGMSDSQLTRLKAGLEKQISEIENERRKRKISKRPVLNAKEIVRKLTSSANTSGLGGGGQGLEKIYDQLETKYGADFAEEVRDAVGEANYIASSDYTRKGKSEKQADRDYAASLKRLSVLLAKIK